MTFDQAVEFVLKAEGGYVFDPRDPGGETRFGISKRSYPKEDIKNLTEQRAKEIYKRDFWDAAKCDQLPAALRLAVFDAAVNQGLGAAIRMLQACLQVTQDGVLGPKSIAAAQKNPESLVIAYMTERAMRYMGTANFDRFGRGWLNRIFHLMKTV